MIEIVWEFLVKEEFCGQFELAYGRGGAWSKLFGKSPGYRGTTLLRDVGNPRLYLTFDIWDSLAQRDQMLAENKEAYEKLDATFAEWTEQEREVGTFRMLAEATVRPQSSKRPFRRRSAPRRGR